MEYINAEQFLKLTDNIDFFKEFTREEKSEMATLYCNVLMYRAGNYIIKQGDIDQSLFVLLNGSARVTKRISSDTDGPTETLLAKLKSGDLFGEISLMTSRPRATNVVAEGDVIALKFEGKMLDKRNPAIANKVRIRLIEILVKRLEDANRLNKDLTKRIEMLSGPPKSPEA